MSAMAAMYGPRASGSVATRSDPPGFASPDVCRRSGPAYRVAQVCHADARGHRRVAKDGRCAGSTLLTA